MKDRKGTPKTLYQAILNGEEERRDIYAIDHRQIEKHVRDYLAQKFNAAMLMAGGDEAHRLYALFRSIVGE